MFASDRTFVTIFLGIFVEALPFLLAGVLVSSAIHLFVKPERLARLIPRYPLAAALVGAMLGLVFPVCECGSVPTARTLMHKGAPVSLGLAFVLASPVVNPIVIATTAVAFAGVLGWGFVAWRIGLTLLIAVVVALALGHTSSGRALVAPVGIGEGIQCAEDTQIGRKAEDHAPTASYHVPGRDELHHDHDHRHDAEQPRATITLVSVVYLLRRAGDELFEMGRYLVLGGLIAAALQSTISPALLLTFRQGIIVPILVMMALAVVLSICSTVDSFVALSFVGSFAPSALLAFLIFGPIVDLKSTLMFTTTFRRRIVVGIVGLTALLVLGLSVALRLAVHLKG